MRAGLVATMVAYGAVVAGAQGAESIKIGFVDTFSGPNAVIGNEQKAAFELALDRLGRKMGGIPVEVSYEDDQQKPDVGRQVTEKLIQVQKVDFLTGYIWSNVLLASMKPAVDSKTFLISANAGPSQIAGEQCSPYFFSTSWQNDQTPMALGDVLSDRKVGRLYLLAPNYAAGKDMAAGVKKTFKGEIVGEEYTRWPGQVDFSTELSKIRALKPDAVWVFYPGQAGVQFVEQYAQAGLTDQIPLYSVFTVDALSLPQLKDLGLGQLSTQEWVQDLDNSANKAFVADFRKKTGQYPSYYAAQAYDAAMLIDSAVTALKGKLDDKEAVRATMMKAAFDSVRGPFRYNRNHFPIQNFYLQQVVKDSEGNFTMKTLGVAVKDGADPFVDKCAMQ